MQRVGSDRRAPQPCGQLVGEQHAGELGPVVGQSRWRVSQYPPTLFTSTSIRGRLRSTSAASRRTSACDDRSATKTFTCPPPAEWISRAASSVRSRSRPVIARCTPIAAKPRAVALPPLAPVTSTVLPAIGALPSCSMSRSTGSGPLRIKPSRDPPRARG